MEPTFVVGDIVFIQGLRAKPELNGKIGVIKAFHQDQGRYEVLPGHQQGQATLGIKPSNLTDQDFVQRNQLEFYHAQNYDHLFFWPQMEDDDRKKIVPVQAFSNFPNASDNLGQDEFIKNLLGWDSVDALTGVEEGGMAKPTFLILFDAKDTTSHVNQAAENIRKLLPDYEKAKMPKLRDDQKIRGICVLVYSPMKSTLSGGGPGFEYLSQQQPTMAVDKNRRFSHQQLRDILNFHGTKDAKLQYQAHDNPMHRVFGGMPCS